MGPLPRGKRWVEYVNQAETEAELRSLRRSPWMGKPYGETVWVQHTAKRLGLESTLRAPGQPKAETRAKRDFGHGGGETGRTGNPTKQTASLRMGHELAL